MRDYRIKESRWSISSPSGAGSVVSSEPLNGEILEVDWTSNRVNGSLFLTKGASSEEVWRRNQGSMAVGTAYAKPRSYLQDSTGAVVIGSLTTPHTINDVLWLNYAGVVSGGTPITAVVRYR